MSIYDLPRLSRQKRTDLVNQNAIDLRNLPSEFSLSSIQKQIVAAAKSNQPQINVTKIRQFLQQLQFPLYFLDYETYASAIPVIDGASPHKHFPVQFSLHILDSDGTLQHKEYLETEARLPEHLISQLRSQLGAQGSILAWHASFEINQNKEMARLYPESSTFFNSLNKRIVDLEEPFKMDYVDARFAGSTSIKKVLPVVCPELRYEDLEIQDGASAMEAWGEC